MTTTGRWERRAGELLAGRYRLLDLLGAGDMGVVWRAEDRLLRRTVALKRVDRHGDDPATARQRLLREGRIGAAVRHPRLLGVLDVLVAADEPWLVLEHVDARSWASWQQQYGPMWPAGAARIGAQVAEGLAVLHSAGIVHGDVTAENILVDRHGAAYLADFGISRTLGDAAQASMAAMTGDRDHRAPETLAGAAPGPAADVYALGAAVHEAVTGAPAAGTLPLPAALGPLARVLSAMSAGDPAQRPDARDAFSGLSAVAAVPPGG